MAGPLDMIIITGLSGSGKSFAIRALEDNGFFCIDNIPALLIPKVIDLSHGHEEEIRRIALGVDLRGGQFLQALPAVLPKCAAPVTAFKVCFLMPPIEVLLRRFQRNTPASSTRWPGFLSRRAFRAKERALEPIRALADKII
jgi:UPF0042 nucleotide-binding protein